MSPRGSTSRSKQTVAAVFAFIIVVALILGFLAIGSQVKPQQATGGAGGYSYPVPPAYQPPGETGGGIL